MKKRELSVASTAEEACAEQTVDRRAPAVPEWRRRWRDLQAARAELARWRETAHEVETGFQRDIAPRERQLTNTLAEVTAHLIERLATEDTVNSGRRNLLALWIMENLDTLSEHPFADQNRVDTLQVRWRSVVAPDAEPCRHAPTESLPRKRPTQKTADSTSDDTAHTRETPFSRASAASSDKTDHPEQPPAALDTLDIRDLLAPLFRRLAQALHPDRERDPMRRKLKEDLMREALDARSRGDVDTLLELHQQHIGELVDIAEGVNIKALLRALEQQMEVVQRDLRAVRYGNTLLEQIVERYGNDPVTRKKRLSRHAQQLDKAIDELTAIAAQVQLPHGLDQALEVRRNAEQDRQLIREMTGAVE